MTTATDPNDTGDIPTGDPTINLASHAYRLRHAEERQRINPAYLHSAETIIIDLSTGQPYNLPKPPRVVPLSHTVGLPSGRDAWIFDISGEMQEPPTGNPPPLPPAPPGPTIPPRPTNFRPAHRRRLSPWIGLAIVVGTGLAMWAGGFLAAAAVIR